MASKKTDLLPSLLLRYLLQEFQVGIEWPMCLPGVGVKLVRKVEEEEGEGEEVMCELQVDWMYAEVCQCCHVRDVMLYAPVCTPCG